MKQALTAFTLLLGLAAVAVPQEDTKNTPPAGFTALFNGKDLTGWQGAIDIKARAKLSAEEREKRQEQANEKILPNWTVKDGVLAYDGKSGSLQTVKDYGNFELLLDWKIAPAGDSGLYLRGNPQVQIWDSDTTPGARGEDKGSGSGGLWNNKGKGKRPLKKADKPVGEWNNFRILMVGDQVTVYLNGELVVDDAPLDNYWEKGQPLPAKGPIELQHHGDPLWFRNIYIRELPE
jgi:hypothetical protein